MSRIGKEPIQIPAGVDVAISDKNVVTVKGPKGTLTQRLDPAITVTKEDGVITFTRPTDLKHHRSMHGLYRSLVSNMVEGVTKGFKTEQELVGVGYRAVA
ncbi:MAG: 50S ribosomal protein L6, partial [Flavobacteriales bacterium]